MQSEDLTGGQDEARKPFSVTSELESWLLEAADEPVTPLTKADFAAIREHGQKPSQVEESGRRPEPS